MYLQQDSEQINLLRCYDEAQYWYNGKQRKKGKNDFRSFTLAFSFIVSSNLHWIYKRFKLRRLFIEAFISKVGTMLSKGNKEKQGKSCKVKSHNSVFISFFSCDHLFSFSYFSLVSSNFSLALFLSSLFPWPKANLSFILLYYFLTWLDNGPLCVTKQNLRNIWETASNKSSLFQDQSLWQIFAKSFFHWNSKKKLDQNSNLTCSLLLAFDQCLIYSARHTIILQTALSFIIPIFIL